MSMPKFVLYGACGLLIEVLFTGLWSFIIDRDVSATSKTSLWMMFCYGPTGLVLEYVSSHILTSSHFTRALVFLPIIYASEFTFGVLTKAFLGVRLWYYDGEWTACGLIQPRYAPFWYFLAFCFSVYLQP